MAPWRRSVAAFGLLAAACGARSEIREGAPIDAAVIDVAAHDAPSLGDATAEAEAAASCHLDAGNFVCSGVTTCDSDTEFCLEMISGGGNHSHCAPLLNDCNASCAYGYLNYEGCSCEDQGGRITVHCDF